MNVQSLCGIASHVCCFLTLNFMSNQDELLFFISLTSVPPRYFGTGYLSGKMSCPILSRPIIPLVDTTGMVLSQLFFLDRALILGSQKGSFFTFRILQLCCCVDISPVKVSVKNSKNHEMPV